MFNKTWRLKRNTSTQDAITELHELGHFISITNLGQIKKALKSSAVLIRFLCVVRMSDLKEKRW